MPTQEVSEAHIMKRYHLKHLNKVQVSSLKHAQRVLGMFDHVNHKS